MIKIETFESEIKLSSINMIELENILKWYNDTSEYKYATGIDMPISMDKLNDKFIEVFENQNEFAVGIYLTKKDNCIGIIKAKICEDNTLWIYMILIDKQYQNMGYGFASINLLLKYLKSNYEINKAYISVAQENIKGIKFWEKLNFIKVKQIASHTMLDNKFQNVIVMEKLLNN